LLIDQLYDDLMVKRLEQMEMRKNKMLDADKLEKLSLDIAYVNEDFESLIKTHTLYLRYKKASGQTKTTHSSEMIKRINDIKANIGKIVTDVPKNE
jgi:hypothetical protein